MLNDAGHLAIVDAWIELFQVENRAGDDVRMLVLPLLGGRAVVDQPNHAALEETLRLLADRVPVDAGDAAALNDALVLEQDAADDPIVMLHRIGEVHDELLKAHFFWW